MVLILSLELECRLRYTGHSCPYVSVRASRLHVTPVMGSIRSELVVAYLHNVGVLRLLVHITIAVAEGLSCNPELST